MELPCISEGHDGMPSPGQPRVAAAVVVAAAGPQCQRLEALQRFRERAAPMEDQTMGHRAVLWAWIIGMFCLFSFCS
eukprot:12159872-Alexandrium_andersonii.AAC.1